MNKLFQFEGLLRVSASAARSAYIDTKGRRVFTY